MARWRRIYVPIHRTLQGLVSVVEPLLREGRMTYMGYCLYSTTMCSSTVLVINEGRPFRKYEETDCWRRTCSHMP